MLQLEDNKKSFVQLYSKNVKRIDYSQYCQAFSLKLRFRNFTNSYPDSPTAPFVQRQQCCIFKTFAVSALSAYSISKLHQKSTHLQLSVILVSFTQTPTHINRLRAIQEGLAHAFTKSPKHHHITSLLKSLHWLKALERLEYKVVSFTCKTLISS